MVVITSVVVTLKYLVVGGGVVVETSGVVALNLFVFSLGKKGKAKEEERGRKNKASIVIAFLWFLLFDSCCYSLFELLISCSLGRWRSFVVVPSSAW